MSSSTKSNDSEKSASAACASQSNVKKVKIAPGGQAKQLAAALIENKASTTIQSAAASKAQSSVVPKQKATAKEAKEGVPASLQRRKDDALVILKQRRKSLYDALQSIATVHKSLMENVVGNLLQKAIAILATQIKATDECISRSELFGRGFAMKKISGVDAQAIVALTAWGSNVDKTLKPDEVATQSPVQEDEVVKKGVTAEDEDYSADKDTTNKISSQGSQATEISEPSPRPHQSLSSSVAKPAPKPRLMSSAFMQKPKRPDGPISRLVCPMHVDRTNATTTHIMDAEAAL